MKKNILTFALILLALIIPLEASIAQRWQLYNTADGLAGESISSIQEDAKGYLWFIARFRGASRYDGVNFQNLNESKGLASDNIYFTLADKEGNFWFATDDGASIYDGKEFHNILADKLINFILQDEDSNSFWFGTENGAIRHDGESFEVFGNADGLVGSNVSFILRGPDGNLWFGTEKGVSKYDGKRFSATNLSESIREISRDSAGNLWFAAERGIYRKDVKSLMIEGPLVEANILSIMEDNSGNIWFSTDNQGLIRYDHKGKNFRIFTSQDGLGSNNIQTMRMDSRGTLWFGTDRGIIRYNGQKLKPFTEIKSNMALGSIETIWEDIEENLWFGTAGNGVCKYSIQALELFTEADGLPDNSVRVILEDREGNLWFGTEKGVGRYNGRDFQNFGQQHGMADDSVLSIFQDSGGDLWFGMASGLCKYNGTSLESVTEAGAPVDSIVTDILEDKAANNLWFATGGGIGKYDGVTFDFRPIANGSGKMLIDSNRNLWVESWLDGVYRYDGKHWEHYTKDEGLGSNEINWMLETQDGNIWFGLEGGIMEAGGVCRYNGTNFRNFTTKDGLVSDLIRAAREDGKGRLWFGTDRGVVKCDNPSLELPSFQIITEDDGLISNNVSSIMTDADGNLWFGTDEGVSKYDSENFQNIPLGHLILGTVHTILEDSKGAMWFVTTRDGVARYIPSAKEIRPRIYITQVEADKIYRNVNSIRVSTRAGSLTFEYKGISFRTGPGKMLYTYMLEEHDNEWSPSTNNTRARYEYLDPGKYRFRVCAIDGELHRSEPATVEIEVFRPWFLTRQFTIFAILGGACVLGGGGYLSIQLGKQRRTNAQLRERLRNQREAEELQMAKMRSLNELVAGIAHQMRNPLSVVSSSNDIFSRTVRRINSLLSQEHIQEVGARNEIAKMLDVLRNMSEMSQSASERISSIITSMRNFVRLDEAKWQRADIHEGLDSAIALLGIDVKKDYGNIQKINCFPDSLNQAFYSMLKNAREATEEGGEISVKTSVQAEYIKIEISDTGRGIPQENLRGKRIFDLGFTTKSRGIGMGLGLPICRKIIEEDHKGLIEVSSKLGEWTTFTIWLPLPK